MSKVRLYGATSGYLELKAPDVSPDAEVEIPAAFGPYGKVLQVVSSTSTSSFSTTSSTYVDITGWSASITPTSASSLILINAVLDCRASTNRYGQWDLEFRRDTTAIWTTDFPFDDAYQSAISKTVVYLDNPATTSSLTYAGRTKFRTGTNGGFNTTLRNVTLLEIAA
jgi:hypothetical protein